MKVEPATGAAGPALPGRLAVFLLIVEAATGLVLMFYYRPTAGTAYLDLVDLREVSRLGFVRELHRWGAYAAVIAVWLHLFQTAVRGAYRAPRRLNWAVGVALMVLTLLLAVTGYLLPFDQGAYWGIAVLSPTGQPVVDASMLLAVYVVHCVAVPLLMAGLTVFHLRRARRDAEIA